MKEFLKGLAKTNLVYLVTYGVTYALCMLIIKVSKVAKKGWEE